VTEDLAGLDREEVERRIAGLREEMAPLERRLAELRGRRDQLLTELKRRDRGDVREARARLREAMRGGGLPAVAELVAGAGTGSFEDYAFSLKTGGEVRLGFPGARAQSLAFTDGVQARSARDLAEAAELHRAGWELGSPGRPGVRIHFPGTRQERVVDAADVFARPLRQHDQEVGSEQTS
jgi:hypothetical protein